MINTINFIGFIGCSLIVISYIPQLIKLLKNKDINNLSLFTYIILLNAQISRLTIKSTQHVAFSLLVLCDQLINQFTHRHNRVDRPHALPCAPDVFPGLGA